MLRALIACNGCGKIVHTNYTSPQIVEAKLEILEWEIYPVHNYHLCPQCCKEGIKPDFGIVKCVPGEKLIWPLDDREGGGDQKRSDPL